MTVDHQISTGRTADNIVGFARALRAAGIPVGPGAVIDAMTAVQLVDIGNRATCSRRWKRSSSSATNTR